MKILEIGSRALTLEDVRNIAVGGQSLRLAPTARRRMIRSERFLKEAIASGATFYGVNTGFGTLSDVRISPKDLEKLQINLLRSHAVGVGPAMPDHYVRAMLLLRAQALALGYSGVRPVLVDQLIAFLNRGICPIVPQQGSVGASGDLAPLAHLALVLIGEGRARFKGREISGKAALKAVYLKPLKLGPKDGLALINGTQFMTGIGALAALEAEHLADVADAAGALSVEAMRGTASAFDARIHRVRPHPGQVCVAKRMRQYLIQGGKSEIAKSHADCGKVQDPYSLRCIPQVHGACRDVFAFVRSVLEREINSVTDNPIVFSDSRAVLSGGNFHGEVVAMAMDFLSIATAELGSISEQRIEKLLNPALSGLPVLLTKKGGLNSGFMIVQVVAASIVSENKTLCHPASVDSITTNVDKEDHVSMGAWAARKAARVVTNSRRVLAMELLAAAQGIDLLRPKKSTRVLEKMHSKIRKGTAMLHSDRSLSSEVEWLERQISKGEI